MSTPPTPGQLQRARAGARLLVSATAVEAAMDTMAAAVHARLGARDPLLLGVMVGGVVPLGMLLRRLDFPLQVDYLHATRYRGTRGGGLDWLRPPPAGVRGRSVLLVDDVLDAGITLAAVSQACVEAGAREVLTAVTVTKRLARRPDEALQQADFSALEAEDAYLFGCGMDYHGYWRNAPGIHAIADE